MDSEQEKRFDKEMERLAQLEEGFRGVRHDVGEIKSTFVAFMNETRSSLSVLSDRINNGQRTQWPVIFSSVGLAITIVGFLATGYVRDLARIEDRQRQLYERSHEENFARGRQSVLTEVMEADSAQVKILRERIAQLEVRASKAEQSSDRVSGLIERLTRVEGDQR